MLRRADQLLKEREDKRVVDLSLSSLKQSTQQVKTSDDIYQSLKSLKVPSDLKVTIALKSEGNKPISLIPPGKELQGRDDLEKLFTMATQLLEKHDGETFSSFSPKRTEEQLTDIKSDLGKVGDQIENKGGNTSWKEQYKKLEERPSMVSVFASDGGVTCSAPPNSSVNIFLDDLNGTGSIKTSGNHSDNTGQDGDHSDLVSNRTGSQNDDIFAVQNDIIRPEPDYDLDLPDDDDLITHTDEDSPRASGEDDDLISETGGDDKDDTTVSKTKTGDINPGGQKVNPGDNDNRSDKTGEGEGDTTDNDENRTGDGDNSSTNGTTKSGTEATGSGGDQGDGADGDSGGDKATLLNAALNRKGSGDGGQVNSDIRRRVVERQRNTINFERINFTNTESKIDNRMPKTAPRKKFNLEERVQQDINKAAEKRDRRMGITNNAAPASRGTENITPKTQTKARIGSNQNASTRKRRGATTTPSGQVNLEKRAAQSSQAREQKIKLQKNPGDAPPPEHLNSNKNRKTGGQPTTSSPKAKKQPAPSTATENQAQRRPANYSQVKSKIDTKGKTSEQTPFDNKKQVEDDIRKAAERGKRRTAELASKAKKNK